MPLPSARYGGYGGAKTVVRVEPPGRTAVARSNRAADRGVRRRQVSCRSADVAGSAMAMRGWSHRAGRRPVPIDPARADSGDAAPVLPDLVDALAHVREVVRIAVEDDEVGALAGLDRPGLAIDAEQLGGAPCRRLEDRRGRHPASRHQLELTQVLPVGRDAAVGAHRDADPGLDRRPEGCPVDLEGQPGLVDHRGWEADPGVDGVEDA